jgi:predicted Fe-Mo cluster-binding NifX family protein
MKIAAVSNDDRSISAHFGRARAYTVLTIEDGAVVQREVRDKSACGHSHHGHGHSHDHHDHHDSPEQATNVTMTGRATPAPPPDPHSSAAALIADCEVVLSRGMGQGMYRNLQRAGVRPVLTDIVQIDDAVAAYLAGTLQEHPELVH